MVDPADHKVGLAVGIYVVDRELDTACGSRIDVDPACTVDLSEVPDRYRTEAQSDGHGRAGLMRFGRHDSDFTVFCKDVDKGLDTPCAVSVVVRYKNLHPQIDLYYKDMEIHRKFVKFAWIWK